MIYNIKISQKRIIEFQEANKVSLSIDHYTILVSCINFAMSGHCNNYVKDGVKSFQLSAKWIMSQLPLLKIKSRSTIFKKLSDLEEAGFIKRSDDTHVMYYMFTDNCQEIVSKNYSIKNIISKGAVQKLDNNSCTKNEQTCTKIVQPLYKNCTTSCTKIVHNNIDNNNQYNYNIKNRKKELINSSSKIEKESIYNSSMPDFGNLISPAKIASLEQWLKFREEIDRGKMNIHSIEAIVKIMMTKTDQEVFEAVNNSIANNYKGLHYPKNNTTFVKPQEVNQSAYPEKWRKELEHYYTNCSECEKVMPVADIVGLLEGRIWPYRKTYYTNDRTSRLIPKLTNQFNEKRWLWKKWTATDWVVEQMRAEYRKH